MLNLGTMLFFICVVAFKCLYAELVDKNENKKLDVCQGERREDSKPASNEMYQRQR